jgi:hypothetical protein
MPFSRSATNARSIFLRRELSHCAPMATCLRSNSGPTFFPRPFPSRAALKKIGWRGLTVNQLLFTCPNRFLEIHPMNGPSPRGGRNAHCWEAMSYDPVGGRSSRCRERKKTPTNLSPPKTRRSSVKAKKGTSTTNNNTERDTIPFKDPPPRADKLS